MSRTADLLVRNAALVVTCDAAGRELPGGWVAVTDGLITGVGASPEPAPEAARTIDAAGCLVTPGLVNTHHHLYQNFTRAFAPAVNGTLFEWLTRLLPGHRALLSADPPAFTPGRSRSIRRGKRDLTRRAVII